LTKENNKKGQMTVWIIIAMVLVLAIVLFFLLRGEITPKVGEKIEENPKNYIASCVKKNVEEAVEIMLPQGGFVSPEHTKLYNDIKVAYLCYNSQYYDFCISEHPVLLQEMEEEIHKYIEPRIEQCFQDYRSEQEKKDIGISLGNMEIDIKLEQEIINVKINREVRITEKGENYKINNFDIDVRSPAYNLGRVAAEIESNEAESCDFDNAKYMTIYPRFKISRIPMSDSTKIYTIEDKDMGKSMNVAIRGCARPPGL